MIGREINGYRIIEPVGEGGMATVYRAYHAAMDRDVAIKVIETRLGRQQKLVDRFRTEARAIAKLEHPHILPVHDFGETDDLLYMVMRYLPVGTLADRIRLGVLPLDEAARIIGQVASALDYAHSQNILHRDVKPSNVLLDQFGNSFLADFGIAKIVEEDSSLTGTGMVGTPYYMSPEACRGSRDLTSAADQYSLGIVLYEMITGRVPYRAETPLAVIHMHLSDPLPLPRSIQPNIPEQAERVLLKALAKDPEARFGSCGEMADRFRSAVQGAGTEQAVKPISVQQLDAPTMDDVLETSPDHGTATVTKPKRRQWLWGVAAAFVAVAGLVTAWLVLSNSANPTSDDNSMFGLMDEGVFDTSGLADNAVTPQFQGQPTPTATSRSVITDALLDQYQEGRTLFSDDFEREEISSAWVLSGNFPGSAGFSLTDDGTGNTVLHGVGWSSQKWATIAILDEYEDSYLASFRIYINELGELPAVILGSEQDWGCPGSGFSFDQSSFNRFSIYGDECTYAGRGGVDVGTSIVGKWVIVQVRVIEDTVGIYVDGRMLSDERHLNRDNLYGRLVFQAGPNSDFWIDDVSVVEMELP